MNKASNKVKQKYCKQCRQLVFKQTYYIHKILYCGGDWSDLSPEIDEIFGVNHDNDGKGHSGGDTIEVGLLSLDHISELPIEGNVESTQAPKSVREIASSKIGWFIMRYKMWLAACSFMPN